MASATRTSTRPAFSGAIRELISDFKRHDLMTRSSALAFQILTAVVPFLLFGLGLIGFLSLDKAWSELAKNIKPQMSQAAFTVLQSTAAKVLHQKDVWWVTIGFALALWEVSGGIRTIMGGLNKVYELDDRRGWFERTRRSIIVALLVSTLILLALAAVWLTPLAYGKVGQPLATILLVLRWAVAGGLLGLATALTMRLAPAGYQPASWVTTGTAIIVGTWLLASILFGVYVRFVASYGSIFGALATIVILFAYIYISAIVFFAGAQVDAIVRRRVEGNPQGR